MSRLNVGDVVKHFKREGLSELDKKTNWYLYKILALNVINTETREQMVVYQSLYNTFDIYVRPQEMFMSEVDINKYPNATQKYRFEKL